MHHFSANTIYAFMVGVILPTYQLLAWIGLTFGKALRRLFIRGERQAIIFMHAKQHQLGLRHQAKSPIECQDDDCIKI